MSEKPFLFHLNYFFRSEVIEAALANFKKTHLSLEVTQHKFYFKA